MKQQESEIPVEGSLGLLALGYAGIRAWRERRAAYEQEHGPVEHFTRFVKDKDTQKKQDDKPEKAG